MGRFGELPIQHKKLGGDESLHIQSGSKDLFGVGTEIFLKHGIGLDHPLSVDSVTKKALDVNTGIQIPGGDSADILQMDALDRAQLDMRQADEIIQMLNGGAQQKKNKELLAEVRISLEKERTDTHH